MKLGYLVKYSKKTDAFGGVEERQDVLCTRAKLIELLQSNATGIVWSAKFLDVEVYQENHEVKLEEWGF